MDMAGNLFTFTFTRGGPVTECTLQPTLFRAYHSRS